MKKSVLNVGLPLAALAIVVYGLYSSRIQNNKIGGERDAQGEASPVAAPSSSSLKPALEVQKEKVGSISAAAISASAISEIEEVSGEAAAEENEAPPPWPEGSVEFEVFEGKYAVSFGDILLGVVPEDRRDVKRAFFSASKSRLWPSARIPFSIQSDTPNQSEILAAVEYFTKHTPVRFVPRTDEEDSIIFIRSEEICASQLGRAGGHQAILVGPQCMKGTIIHELMHALGFVHEHSREDRDRYIDILWANIQPEYHSQFQLVPDFWVHEYRGSVFDFDPQSIMLYGPTAYALQPGLTTIKSKAGVELAPQREGLSRLDLERLYYLYGR